MIKAILAVDDKGGVSRNGSMPWPKNSLDLDWFQNNTNGNVIIMGRKTWVDPKMHNPLPNRVNVLVTNRDPEDYPGASMYINGELRESIDLVIKKFPKLIKWVIGGPNIVDQMFPIIEQFYLTRIYGDFNCDLHLSLSQIKNQMKMIKHVQGDKTCHFEIWSK